MPKRPNPFGDCSPLQFKTHISAKEVNLGVGQEQNMRAVYDRTKDLLYQGSKQSLSPCKYEPMTDLTEVESRTSLPAQALTGQLRIDSDGYLCGATEPKPQVAAGGFSFQMQVPSLGGAGPMDMDTGDAAMLNNNNVMMPYPPPSGQMTLDPSGRLSHKAGVTQNTLTAGSSGCRICQSCNRPCSLRPRVCSFCEKITCSNCLQQCHNCEGLFCHMCSTINYDDCVDKIFCLQCSN